jgi:hypothetical protein
VAEMYKALDDGAAATMEDYDVADVFSKES